MTRRSPSRYGVAHAYCLLAGGMDSLTGLLLVSMPLSTLGLMGIPEMPAEPVYLRFVGAFVGGVGLSYLYPFLYRRPRRTDRTLAVVLEVTALVRFGIAAFIAWAIGSGALPPAWLSVLVTDAVLATVQLFMVRRQVLARDRDAGGGGR